MKQLKKVRLNDVKILTSNEMKFVIGGYHGPDNCSLGSDNKCGGTCAPEITPNFKTGIPTITPRYCKGSSISYLDENKDYVLLTYCSCM